MNRLYPNMAAILVALLAVSSTLAQATTDSSSSPSLEEYSTAFEKFDKDGSGRLEEAELDAYLENFSPALTQLLSKIRSQSDGLSLEPILLAASHLKRIQGQSLEVQPDQREAFARWDSNGDGQLTPAEVNIVLPKTLREALLDQFDDRASISFEDYERGFARFAQPSETRRVEVVPASAVELPISDAQAADTVRGKLETFLAMQDARRRGNRTEDRQVRGDRPETATPVAVAAAAQPDEAVAVANQASALKPMSATLVVLSRKVEELPGATLADTVMEAVGNKGGAMTPRLLPWLNGEEGHGIKLLEYVQLQCNEHDASSLQRGARQPFVSSMTNSGARSYDWQQVGSLIHVKFKRTEGDRLQLGISYEKSYSDPPADEEGEEDEEDESESDEDRDDDEEEDSSDARRSEERNAPGSRQAMTREQFEAAVRRSRGGSFTNALRMNPPTLRTITAEGTVHLTPGQVIVLKETGQIEGDVFEEIVILVQLNH